MSGYLPSVKVDDLEFEGDKVTCVLTSPSRKDLLKLSRLLPTAEQVKAGNRDPEKEMELLDSFGDVLPKYVGELNGLTDANGAAVTIEQVCSSFYFIHLVSALGMRLVQLATPNPTKRSAAR